MSDQLDHELARRLDTAIGEAPTAASTLDGLLAAGRRAHTRRRLVQGSAALAFAVAVGGGAVAAAGLGGSAAGPAPSVATEPPTSTATASASASDRGGATAPPAPMVDPEELATLGSRGLELGAGVSLVEQVENPLQVSPPAQSLGLVVERRGQRFWMMLRDSPQGWTSQVEEAGWAFSSFDLWLGEAVAVYRGEPTLALVSFGARGGEELVPAEDGVEIVEQRSSPPLPPDFDGSERSAVAEVAWRGEQWFVLATQQPGAQPGYHPVEASVAGQTTIDGYLDFAWERYNRELARERAENGSAG